MKFPALFLSFFLASPLFAQNSHETGRDSAFLTARDAFRAGDRNKFERAAAMVGGNHDLAPYIDYFQLRMNLEQSDPGTLRGFLTLHERSLLAERLRADWLRLMARKMQWSDFEAEFPKLLAPEQDLSCLNLQARLARYDKTALDDAQPLWLSLLEPPEACQAVLETLVQEKRVGIDDVWTRVHRQLEANRLGGAKATMNYLPANQVPDARQKEAAIDKAMAMLAKLPGNWAATRSGRELAAIAIQRVAANDPRAAAEQLEKLQDKMEDSERQWAWSQVALQAARRHIPEALAWYAKAAGAVLSDEGHQWKVRAALRAHDWGTVHASIEAMPAYLAALPEWAYWLGRAHKAGGRLTQANALFERIAGQPNFYGTLADEELERSLNPPPKANALTKEEIAGAAAHPGLKRALAFLRLDLRTEGVKEWNWSLRGMNDRELLAAAELARRHHIYDRAIAAADRTKSEHDYSLRYLAPFGEQIRPAAKNQALDDAWVYGLMRQESRFITNAKSSVGASGLMQLMPSTAKWVAKKIGLKDFKQGRVNDTEVNVLLGTSYMRMVLASLDNHPVLASAAYNAGPGRARRWRADQPLEGAIYAETIPFPETRDYVKKVMCNSVYYSALFNGKPTSLKARLGTVGARVADSPKDADLP